MHTFPWVAELVQTVISSFKNSLCGRKHLTEGENWNEFLWGVAPEKEPVFSLEKVETNRTGKALHTYANTV